MKTGDPAKDASRKKIKKYTIAQISEISGFTRRTIRYYVQRNILDPPSGRGRGGFYFDSHLSNLQKIRALREKKVNLDSIKNMLHGKGLPDFGTSDFEALPRDLMVRYEIIPGLEINISRKLEEEKGKKIQDTIRFIRSIF